jgi:hypothetical protein
MDHFFSKIGVFFGGILLTAASWFGVAPQMQQPSFGAAFNPVQAQKTYLSGSGIETSDNSINLTSLTTPNGTAITMSNFGNIGYATIDAGTSKEENISFSGITQNANGTAQLTGVSRGLGFTYPYTASASLAYAHSGGAAIILSNSAAFYSQFNIAANISTITGSWTFASSSLPQVTPDTTSFQVSASQYNLATVGLLNSVAIGGAVANFSSPGSSQLATTSQSLIGTATTSFGTSTYYLVVPNASVNQSSTANKIPIANASGTIDPNYVPSNSLLFTNATSGVPITNSNGVITSAVQPGTSGNVLTSNGSTWTSTAPSTSGAKQAFYQSTSMTPSQNVTTTMITYNLPLANSGTTYLVNAQMTVPVSNTALILNLGGTNLLTCSQLFGYGTIFLQGYIQMLGSTSSEAIWLPQYQNGTTPTSTCAVNTTLSLNLSTTTALTIQTRETGGSFAATATLQVNSF